ncbi:ABC transporter ATP-binding protein [Undibacterium sp. TJN19]|uniref:ABC transporter ATP-binding protein n=1 Tax=Undibacterium sp. TJN19 TaxID=3413055 RepID=UPI003BF24551
MSAQQNTVLQATDLSFHYPGHALFSNCTYDIKTGITLVRGGDGRGKTSLLQLLAGAMPAETGQLQIQGVFLHAQPDVYRSQVFWIDPRTEEFDQMAVPDYFASLHARYPQFDDVLLAQMIEGLGLAPHLNKQLFMLSTGSKRKVWLAAAFAAGATVILLDDPFAALDRASIQFVVEVLNQAASRTHQAWVVAMYTEPQGVALSALIDLGD